MSAAVSRPRGRPRDEERTARRREEILAAATRLFAQRGYPGLDVQHLADALGVGKGTVYRYFRTKRALFLAAVDHGMQRLTGQIDRIVDLVADPLERMRVGIRTYLEFFASNPDLVELFIQERAEFRDRETPTYFLYRERNVRRWEDLVHGLVAEGRVRSMPVERACHVVGDLLYGTMFTNYFSRRRIPAEQQAADIIDLTFRGILTDEERGRLYGQ